jgi:hypothetical protein
MVCVVSQAIHLFRVLLIHEFIWPINEFMQIMASYLLFVLQFLNEHIDNLRVNFELITSLHLMSYYKLNYLGVLSKMF